MISVIEIEEAGVTLIEPGEKLTLENANEFFHIVRTVPVSFSPAVVVNMERTKIVDSAGVGALVKSLNHMKEVRGRFALAGLCPEVQRSFQLMNLHQVFEIYENEPLARAAMKTRIS